MIDGAAAMFDYLAVVMHHLPTAGAVSWTEIAKVVHFLQARVGGWGEETKSKKVSNTTPHLSASCIFRSHFKTRDFRASIGQFGPEVGYFLP